MEKIKLTIVNSTKQKISQILGGKWLYTHSDQVLIWNTPVLHNHVFVTLYTCILSNFKVPVHKLIDSILLFFWKITCVCITKWYSVSPPFQYDCSENETLDFSFQKRQTICFNLKSVSPGCIFQRLYQSHPFHIYIQVPVYEEIRNLSQKKKENT